LQAAALVVVHTQAVVVLAVFAIRQVVQLLLTLTLYKSAAAVLQTHQAAKAQTELIQLLARLLLSAVVVVVTGMELQEQVQVVVLVVVLEWELATDKLAQAAVLQHKAHQAAQQVMAMLGVMVIAHQPMLHILAVAVAVLAQLVDQQQQVHHGTLEQVEQDLTHGHHGLL
jgi:hypothetical protein